MGLIDDYRWMFKAEITRIVDGDTMDAIVDQGFGNYKKTRFRIVDIDTPETWRPKSQEELEHGLAATKRANQLMPVSKCDSCGLVKGTQVIVETFKSAASIYGRYDARITLDDGTVYALLMIEEGYQKRTDYGQET